MSTDASNHSHAHNPEESLKEAIETLKEAGHKNTRIRKALLEVLLKEHGPFSAEDLQQKVNVECDLATVYRNLSLLESLRLVGPCDFGDGTTRYEWVGEDHEHHHHIICRNCHKVEQLEYCVVKDLEKLVQKRGYRDVSHRLEFYGQCDDCADHAS